VHYTGRFSDGEVFDSSRDRTEPLQFTIGQRQVIPGFEKGVTGMSLNDTKTIEIPAEEAYGSYRQEMVLTIEKEHIPQDAQPQAGQHIMLDLPDGRMLPATVVDVADSGVTVDCNHPLAGKDLTFDIELVEIL
jgi:FKBP-type peptidyl-prolyl cis-trans isomerase SlpA